MQEHIVWLTEELKNWAATSNPYELFVCDEDYDHTEEDITYDMIHQLVESLEKGTCSKEDYDNILFHLWQQKGEH